MVSQLSQRKPKMNQVGEYRIAHDRSVRGIVLVITGLKAVVIIDSKVGMDGLVLPIIAVPQL